MGKSVKTENKKEKIIQAKNFFIESDFSINLYDVSKKFNIPQSTIYKKSSLEKWEEEKELFWQEAKQIAKEKSLDLLSESIQEIEKRHISHSLYFQKEVIEELKEEMNIERVECAVGGFSINHTFERLKCLKIGMETIQKAIDIERKSKRMDKEIIEENKAEPITEIKLTIVEPPTKEEVMRLINEP